LFGLSTLIHLVQSIQFRTWWLLPTVVVGGLGEILGWAARTWSSKSPDLQTPFIMQISATIISPTFILAAHFMILGKLVRLLGPQYSRLRPRTYTVVFVSCDLAALIIQAIGAAQASNGTDKWDQKKTDRGGNIMLGSIVLQMLAITAYTILAFEFVFRLLAKKPFNRPRKPTTHRFSEFNGSQKLAVVELTLCSVFLLIRSAYRTAELASGWNGRVIATEWLFIAFDGSMIAGVMISMNIFHVGMLLKPSYSYQAKPHDIDISLAQLPWSRALDSNDSVGLKKSFLV